MVVAKSVQHFPHLLPKSTFITYLNSLGSNSGSTHGNILNNAKVGRLSAATNRNVVIALEHCSILLYKPFNNS